MTKKGWSDPLGAHVRLYHSLLNTPAWRVLGPSAVKLYIDMRMAMNGSNNGSIGASLSLMKHKGWTAPTTLAKALYELRALGFIAVTIEGGLRQGSRVPSLYRFTDVEVYEQPKTGVQAIKATHDYRAFESVREAERALTEGLERLRTEGRQKQQSKKKSPVQNSYPSNTETVPEPKNFQYRN